MALIILDHDNGYRQSDGIRAHGGHTLFEEKGTRQHYTKLRTFAKARAHGDVAAKTAHQRAHMGKADALARLVLAAGAAEQFKHTLPVLIGDAAAIVAH